MAHLWRRDTGAWTPLLLDGESVRLDDTRVLLLGGGDPRRRTWILLNAPESDVCVNGYPTAGLRVLADRDEIRVARAIRAATFFFSTETLAFIESFPGAERPLFCPRCKQEISAGTPAVQCPQCHVWHHQTDELPCWTYTKDHCALCPEPTELTGTYRWTPEEL